ncbi:MAG TPA: hypothetical protein VGX48_25570 [Pyrinomonadaceae bacterium]|jgi:hypothetical protein|nr:hypothetical protein [Pyrinomonadaceae bacterium]
MKKILLIIAALGFINAPVGAAAQCRGTDRAITKPLRFARGRTTAVVKDTVRLCTSHEFVLRARAGQTMSVHLATGRKTSFTLQSPSGTVEGADGVKDWSGDLPESGDYVIIIGTDATAAYTLEVTIR